MQSEGQFDSDSFSAVCEAAKRKMFETDHRDFGTVNRFNRKQERRQRRNEEEVSGQFY